MRIPWPRSGFVRFVLSLFIGILIFGIIASLTESQVCVPTAELRWNSAQHGSCQLLDRCRGDNGIFLEQLIRCRHPVDERWEQVR